MTEPYIAKFGQNFTPKRIFEAFGTLPGPYKSSVQNLVKIGPGVLKGMNEQTDILLLWYRLWLIVNRWLVISAPASRSSKYWFEPGRLLIHRPVLTRMVGWCHRAKRDIIYRGNLTVDA